MRIRKIGIPPAHPAAGFTLVEALVALLTLSIGLLGVAGLQLAGVRANQSAAWRSQASYLAYDILERMRINQDARADYVVGLEPGEAEEEESGGEEEAGGEEEEEEVPPNAIAVADVSDWKANLAATMPGGDGSIALDPADDLMVIITVQWTDSRGDTAGDADATPLSFTMRSRL